VDVLSTAVSGLQASSAQFRVAANNIVNANTPNYEAKQARMFSQAAGFDQGNASGVTTAIVESGNEVDLASEFINLTQAKITYTANAKVINVAEELVGSLLDIKG
jgi:flagellar hook protein FlgE